MMMFVNSLDRIFNRWQLTDFEPAQFDPNTTQCRMKILTDNNGHVKVKTIRKDPGKDWNIQIEEYDRGKPLKSLEQTTLKEEGSQKGGQGMQNESSEQKLQGQTSGQTQSKLGGQRLEGQPSEQTSQTEASGQLSKQAMDEEMQKVANEIKRDVESTLSQSFNTWNLFEYEPFCFNPDRATYRMKIRTDDNGHVVVKTTKKEPGQPWKTHVKEFFKTSKSKALAGERQQERERSSQSQGLQGQSQSQEKVTTSAQV